VAFPAATTVRPLLMQLRSDAPQVVARATGGGTVVNPGHQGQSSDSGIRVRVNGPSWLVFGQSYDAGWQASCNGHSLGPPRVVDGFANAWPVSAGCEDVSIVFAPQSEVWAGYVLGGAACVLLVLVLVLARRGPRPAALTEPLRSIRPQAWRPLRHAALGGLLGAIAFGFIFGLRAGAVVGPAFALILWRRVSTRRLIAAAGVLLALVVPLLYLLFPSLNEGGYDPGYAGHHLPAHWVTVAAVALVALVLAIDLRAARGRLKTATHRPPDGRGAPRDS
jgi:hypothetical protein